MAKFAQLRSNPWALTFAVFSFVSLLIMGYIHLFFPFSGDQALFMVGAKSMADGHVLYRDFWDLKQPGIFLFSYWSGLLFSFNEWGVHLFEWIHWLLFSIYGIYLLTKLKVTDRASTAYLFPVFTTVLYYLLCEADGLTQVEALVSFAFFIAFTLPLLYLSKGHNPIVIHFLMGLLYAIVFYYKLVLMLVLGIYSIFYVLFLGTHKKESVRQIFLKTFLPIATGFFFLVGIGALYYWQRGILPLVVETFFVTPNQIIAEVEAKSFRAFLGGTWEFVLLIAPCLPFALLGLWHYRNRQPVLIGGMIIWILAGLFTIYLQKFSYWSYHYQLLLFPIGFLNLLGLDFILQKALHPPFRPILIALFLYLPFVLQFHQKVHIFSTYNFVTTPQDQIAYQNHYEPNYQASRQEISFLTDAATLSGDIYVCGNPLFYHLSGRLQSIAITGWSLEFFPQTLWDQILQQLKETKTVYLFVDQGYQDLIAAKHPALSEYIRNGFVPVRKSSFGTWYQLVP